MFQAKTADELIAWLREHASHQNFLYEGETTMLLTEIDRLHAELDAAEVDAKRWREKYESLRGLQVDETERLRALNAELVYACGVAHGAILTYGDRVKEFGCEPWLDVDRLSSLLRDARFKAQGAGIVPSSVPTVKPDHV